MQKLQLFILCSMCSQHSSNMGTFGKIPHHNQMEVLRKLAFTDFIRLKQCSQETVRMTRSFRHRLPLKVHSMTFRKKFTFVQMKDRSSIDHDLSSFLNEAVRFETKQLHVYSTNPKGIALEEICQTMQIRAELLRIRIEDTIGIRDLNSLIKILKTSSLNISSSIPHLETRDGFRRLKEIHLTDVELEEDFLLLETPRISIEHGNFDLSLVNRFLKQWIQGKRRIEELVIDPIPEEHLELFEGLKFFIHSAEPTELDYIHQLVHVYSLTREDGKILFISIDCLKNNGSNTQRRLLAGEYNNDDVRSWIRSKYLKNVRNKPQPRLHPALQNFPRVQKVIGAILKK